MIGSHLVERLMEEGARVDVLDDLSRGSEDNLPNGGFRMWRYQLGRSHVGQAPLCGWPLVHRDEAFRSKDVVFHLAARVTGIHYNQSHQWKMMMDNLAINQEVAQLVARHGPKHYVYVSTACVYPHDAPIPTPEEAAKNCNPEPTNYGYGVAKWVGEQQASFLHTELGIPTAIIRFFNAAGPRDYYDHETSHVIPALIRRFKEGNDPVVIWGTGLQSRVFVDNRDLAQALMIIAEEGCFGLPVNVGHDKEVTIMHLAEMIKELLDSPAALEFDASKPEGYERRAADTSRLRQITGGWVPDRELSFTLMDMIDDYERRYPNGYVV